MSYLNPKKRHKLSTKRCPHVEFPRLIIGNRRQTSQPCPHVICLRILLSLAPASNGFLLNPNCACQNSCAYPYLLPGVMRQNLKRRVLVGDSALVGIILWRMFRIECSKNVNSRQIKKAAELTTNTQPCSFSCIWFTSQGRARQAVRELRNRKTPTKYRNTLPIICLDLCIYYDELETRSFFGLISETIDGYFINETHKMTTKYRVFQKEIYNDILLLCSECYENAYT
jgi:hypothetical protein